MPQLVVTVHPTGKVETLLKDHVLNTRMFGDRKIERISIIEFDDKKQAFYVHWLKGPHANQIHTLGTVVQIYCYGIGHGSTSTEIVYYDTYEEAVEAEVDAVNKLRLDGYSFT